MLMQFCTCDSLKRSCSYSLPFHLNQGCNRSSFRYYQRLLLSARENDLSINKDLRSAFRFFRRNHSLAYASNATQRPDRVMRPSSDRSAAGYHPRPRHYRSRRSRRGVSSPPLYARLLPARGHPERSLPVSAVLSWECQRGIIRIFMYDQDSNIVGFGLRSCQSFSVLPQGGSRATWRPRPAIVTRTTRRLSVSG